MNNNKFTIKISSLRSLVSSLLLFFSLFLFGCASIGTTQKGFDFSKIQKIGVLSFTPYNNTISSSGEAVSDEFTRQLLMKGYTVVESRRAAELLDASLLNTPTLDFEDIKRLGTRLGVDYLLTGTVIEYRPEKRYLVIQGEDDMIAIDGISQDTSYNPDMKTSIVVSNAEVGISARLLEVETGAVVWVGTYDYEAFDIRTANEWTVQGLLRAFQK